jgi:hypothetical protein
MECETEFDGKKVVLKGTAAEIREILFGTKPKREKETTQKKRRGRTTDRYRKYLGGKNIQEIVDNLVPQGYSRDEIVDFVLSTLERNKYPGDMRKAKQTTWAGISKYNKDVRRNAKNARSREESA